MITILTGLLASRWGKCVLEAVILCGLVFGAYKMAEHVGRDRQKAADDQAQQVANETSRKDAVALKDQLVQQANSKADAAEQRAQLAQQEYTQLAGLVASLTQKSEAGRQQVSAVADSDLHADVVAKLALRRPGDGTPGYLPLEERAIDNTITQYPIEVEKNHALAEEVQKKSDQAQAESDVADARQAAFAADESYIAVLGKYYAELFNQHAPHKRAAKCLYLWGCGRLTINLDPPSRPAAVPAAGSK